MSTVATRPRSSKATTARSLAVASTQDKDSAFRSPFGHAAGRHLVQDHYNMAWPEINAGDVLDIDFDCRRYSGEGQYLLHREPPPDEVVGAPGRSPFSSRWTGVRHVTRTPAGLEVRERAIDGWEWKVVSADDAARLHFLGKVRGVYRRTGVGALNGFAAVGKLSTMGEDANGGAFVRFRADGGRELTLSGMTGEEARQLAPLMLDTVKLELSS